MANVAAMIPVLLGSTRVPDKNILLVDGRVLCSYSIEACKESGAFSEVFLNSENGVFAEIAEKEGAKFHPRPADFGGRQCQQKTKSRDCAGNRCVTNEHYLYNFMTTATDADYVCQVNATSPLLKAETMKAFVDAMVEGEYDSFFATEEVRAESFYNDEPVTHSCKYKRPSNEIEPIQVVCWSIAGWKRTSYIESYDRDDINEDGPVFVGKRGVFPIDEREALDIDTWPTLDVIEKYLIARRTGETKEWEYIDGRTVTGG
jgi:CMP-N-acetylneuraminic acid synthetase